MADIETIRESTLNFEAQLQGYYNNLKAQSGVILKLLIHPEDIPPALLTHKATTRFSVVVVQIGDDEEPVVPNHIEAGKKMIASANMICREAPFQEFMKVWAINNKVYSTGETQGRDAETLTKIYLRNAIKVESFKELKENQTAQRFFTDLRAEYEVTKLAGEV